MSLPTNPKIQPLSGLLPLLEAARQRGAKVIFTNGCYDILHPGHVDLLTRCRALGGADDVLVLGLNSDASVRRQGKYPPRPLNVFADRAFVLAGLAAIDFVVGFEEDTPQDLIEAIKPDILVKGGDWPPEKIVGRDCVLRGGGQVLSLPLLPGYSTTGLIEKIQLL